MTGRTHLFIASTAFSHQWILYKDLFSRLGEWSELGTRIGYFEKVKNARAKANGGKIDRSDLVSATLESRDLMDFSRGGKAGRSWNNAVTFANANLQGWDKFFRTYDVIKEWQLAMRIFIKMICRIMKNKIIGYSAKIYAYRRAWI